MDQDSFLSVRGRSNRRNGDQNFLNESGMSSPSAEGQSGRSSPTGRLPLMLGRDATHGAQVDEGIAHSLEQARSNRARVEVRDQGPEDTLRPIPTSQPSNHRPTEIPDCALLFCLLPFQQGLL